MDPSAQVSVKIVENTIIWIERKGKLPMIVTVSDRSRAACLAFGFSQQESILRFRQRIDDRRESPSNVLISLINYDARHGKELGDELMPGFEEQAKQLRAQGLVPIMRGLVERLGITDFVRRISPTEAAEMEQIKTTIVLIVSAGIIAAFRANVFDVRD